ncbi:MAG: hypothetical protein IPJ03_14855 [Ignavibacteriales bacterium]|nr:hypothetical protein [Ignavibacteriales bacterium]
MKTKIKTFILCFFVLTNLIFPQDDSLNFHPPIIRDEKQMPFVSEIKLEQEPGQAFIKWKVIIKSDLTAYYENFMHSGDDSPYNSNVEEKMLRYQGTLDKYFYKRLDDLIQTIRFFSMEDKYGKPHSHSGILTLSATHNNEIKSIWIINDEPVELWALKNLILYLKDNIIKWKQIN